MDHFVATRPWSFSASIIPSLLGSILAKLNNNVFSWQVLLLTLICVLSVHCAGNLVNTYYDYYNGIDTKYSSDTTIVSKRISSEHVFYMFICAYIFGFVSFGILLQFLKMQSNNEIVYCGIVFFSGVLFSFLYTGGIGLKYYALGDVVILLAFGPVIVYFSYIVQTGTLSFKPLLYSFPLNLHVEAILHGNNIRDLKSDCRFGIITIPILFGKALSCYLFYFILFMPYVICFVFSLTYSLYFMLPFFSSILAFQVAKRFSVGNLFDIPEQTAKLTLVFGLLYCLSFLLLI